MNNSCQNCDQIISDNFCGNCGQKKFKRIDKKYIWDEIQYTFLHTNKGFLYSIKSILKNPGKTAKEFVDGNRVNHYKPILLAFVLSGISAFISFKVLGLYDMMSKYYAGKHMSSAFMNDYMSITSSYNSIIMLLSIPFFALFTKIAFRNWGHNYYEHIVLNSYVLCFYTLVNILCLYPFLFFFKGNIEIFMLSTGLAIFTIPFILIWFFKEVYPGKSLLSILGRVMLTMVVMILGFILLMILLVFLGVMFAAGTGAEAQEYMRSK